MSSGGAPFDAAIAEPGRSLLSAPAKVLLIHAIRFVTPPGAALGGIARTQSFRFARGAMIPGRVAKNDADWRSCGGKPGLAPEWSWPGGKGSRDPRITSL
jgi:hypothetical protein